MEKYRIDHRFRFSELSLGRIISALSRRVESIPHKISWKGTNQSRDNLSRLEAYRDSHKAGRCFIIGNGPSIQNTDLSILKDEVTFGLNRIYLNFEKMGFETTYFVSINELVLEQFYRAIGSLSSIKFLNWNRRDLFPNADPTIQYLNLSLSLRDQFGLKPTDRLYGGGTVTYVALQLAYFMGFREVILVGVDHSFHTPGIPNRTVIQRDDDLNHFHPEYFPLGSRWQLPDLKRSEAAYTLARRTFEADGRQIVDATIGGQCQVFKKVDYHSLFS